MIWEFQTRDNKGCPETANTVGMPLKPVDKGKVLSGSQQIWM
jgi:hypothetical protein